MKTCLLALLIAGLLLPSLAFAQDELVCVAFPDGSTEQRVSYYMGEGAGFFASGQYDRALDSYSCVVEQIDANYVPAYIHRALAYTARHDYELAIEDYTAALDLDGSLTGVYNNRGIVHAALQQYDEAIADFNAALSQDADYVLGYSNRAVVAAVQGDYDTAIADLQTALDLSGIQSIVDTLRDPNRDPNAPRPEFDKDHARIYGLLGIVRSAQALDNYNAYLLLLGSNSDYRIQSAAGALESRFTFELRLDDGTWLLAADFTEAGEALS